MTPVHTTAMRAQYPLVSAICLTADRQAFTERAIRCFEWQDYPNKQLVVLDSGAQPFELKCVVQDAHFHRMARSHTDTIGSMRNLAIAAADGELIVHWDSDDWSAPDRITQQVHQLQDCDADIVGACELPFWDYRTRSAYVYRHQKPTYIVGTTMMYRRSMWQEHKFPSLNRGEDTHWHRELGALRKRSFSDSYADGGLVIAAIHEGNSMDYSLPLPEWRRAPEWDERARKVMAL